MADDFEDRGGRIAAPATPGASRRHHDLDALRAFAMLLGIALHAALSLVEGFWPVRDVSESGLLGLAVGATHGFRMPLFFLVSGFFTAMLWRRRGLRALLQQRALRIALPLALGALTIVPAMNWIIDTATQSGIEKRRAGWADAEDPNVALRGTIFNDDLDAVRRLLDQGAEADQPGRDTEQTPLFWAASLGRPEICALLIERGADVNERDPDGNTPLHAASFFGRIPTVELLLARGADRTLANKQGATAADSLAADRGLTSFIAAYLGMQIDHKDLESRRKAVAALLGAPAPSGAGFFARLRALQKENFFHHLWFLWYLCWLVAAFALVTLVITATGWRSFPAGLVISPWRYLWLIPITALAQATMGLEFPTFGPETATGIIPSFRILTYYAIFFFFGALYFAAEDRDGKMARLWFLTLPLGIVFFLPLGLVLVYAPLEGGIALHGLAALVQAAYAWLLIFGLFGAFRSIFKKERRWVRYLSDASYWLYLAHLPLVIAAQLFLRDWEAPALLKFTLIVASLTLVLLVIYEFLVRYRWLGRILNGLRSRTP